MTQDVMIQGRIVSAHGQHYVAQTDQQRWHCYTRSKRTNVYVGDYVSLSIQGAQEARIEAIAPRHNLLYRSDEMRSKQFAANVDVLLFITAVTPSFSEDLLGRALIAAWHEGMTPVIVLNKIDLVEGLDQARARLATYRELGVTVIECTVHEPAALKRAILPLIQGKTALLLGQSAMGKSSILNVLVPHAQAATRAHSHALGAGRHTTTKTELYTIDTAAIIDSPGFQNFGLLHLDENAIVNGFPEFGEALKQCRFYNCRHLQEPNCGVTAAVAAGLIRPQRYALYERIIQEKDQASQW